MFGKALLICAACLIANSASVKGELAHMLASISTGLSSLSLIDQTNHILIDTRGNKSLLNVDDSNMSLAKNLEEINSRMEYLMSKKNFPCNWPNLYQFCMDAVKIDDRYKEFLTMIDPNRHFDDKTKVDFAKRVLKGWGMKAIIQDLHDKLNSKSFVFFLDTLYKDLFPFCKAFKPRQRFFYDLYVSILIQELKGYIMMRYAHEVYRDVLKQDYFFESIMNLNYYYEIRIYKTLKTFKPMIDASSRDMHRCDLQKYHVEGKTYATLKNLFTRIFLYGSEIEKKQFHCSTECPSDNDILGMRCDDDCQIKQRKCNNLVHCDHATDIHLCLENNQNRLRRYTHVYDYYSQLELLWYNSTSCANEFFIRGANKCSLANACNCVCDESENSDRYFSLANVTSNVDSNYVVTGVKMSNENGIVRLKIQQGKLRPFGFINQNTVNWMTNVRHNESYYDYEVIRADEINQKNNTLNNKGQNGTEDDYVYRSIYQKYHKITWAKNRGIFLNNVESPKGYVVTGIRFSTDKMGEERFLKIEIQSTRFDFVTGKLDSGSSFWNSSHVGDFKNNLIKLDECDAPVNVNALHLPDIVENKITYFTTTNILSQNTGSSVVPYLDIQPLQSTVSVPLSAMGLGLMGATNSGGYLILTTKSLNVLPYLTE